MSITIFSRPVRTGKTTELLQWCSRQKNIAGIAMPDIDGLRKIMDLRTHEVIDAELNSELLANSYQLIANSSIIEIGKYKFYRSAFEQANDILLNAWASRPDWLVIDELGRLELKGEGFYPAAKQILAAIQQRPETKILLVVREGLVDEIMNLFQLKNYKIVSVLSEVSNDQHLH